MSRAYRIKVSETVSRVVHVNDGLDVPIELFPILPVERLREALKAVLREQGFKIEGDKATLDLGDGVTATVDTIAGTASLRAEREEAVSEHVETETWGDTDYGNENAQKQTAQERARKEGERRIAAKEEAQRVTLTALLESKLPTLKAILDKAVNKTNLEALKEKARGMGQVESIEESPDGNSMSIKVKV